MGGMSSPSEPSLADLAALVVALDREERITAEQRRDRDLRFVPKMPRDERDRGRLALAWLDLVCADDSELRQRREQARHAFSWMNGILLAGGFLFGILATVGALYYDGSGRINVVAVLAVLLVLPTVFLLLFVFAALPTRTAGWVPGGRALAALARGMNPARLSAIVLRRLPRDWRGPWEMASGRIAAHEALYAGLRKWVLLRGSQFFALGFQAAAVATAVWLVVFSDLAFGWSTTLSTGQAAEDARRLHSFTSILAAPWSWAIDGSQPTLELVRESRYYRVASAGVSPEEAARLGGWWRFVVLALLLYGLLPRVVTATIAHGRLQRALRSAFVSTPGVTGMLARLQGARIATTATRSEDRDPSSLPSASAANPSVALDLLRGFDAVINWSSLPVEDTILSGALGGVPVHHAGGSATLDEDHATIEALAANGTVAVAIAVKAWEPPLLELLDFARALRQRSDAGHDVVIIPMATTVEGHPMPAEPAHFEVWRKRVVKTGDPWLRIGAMPEEVAR